MVRRLVPALIVLALAASACSGDDAAGPTTTAADTSPAPAAQGPGGFTPEPVAWERCGTMECARVEVPLDYAEVDGRRIQLFVTRAPATGRRVGPLFVNPGGPGGSAVEFAAALPSYLPSSVTERFDIVGVEPRGLVGSEPFDCGIDFAELYAVDPTVEDAGDRATLIDTATTYAAGCAARAGDLLPHVGTRDVARDIDAVRAAMGEAQLSYYGASYGTAIGQVYADLFPERVRAMVLDAVVELGPTGLELAAEQAAGFEVALHRFADHCTSSRSCSTDDPIAAVERVQAAAERPGGIPAPGADRAAGPGEVNLGLGNALYSQRLWTTLDRALSAALDGDGSGLVSLADSYLGIGDFDVYFAVNCLDYAWPSGDPDAFLSAAKAAAVASPHFGEALVTDYLRCVDWPVAPDPIPATSAPGTPTILVISTTGDPATPYEAGVAVADRLEAGVLLTNEGNGHGAVPGGSSCIVNHFATYLIDLRAPEDGTVCPDP